MYVKLIDKKTVAVENNDNILKDIFSGENVNALRITSIVER